MRMSAAARFSLISSVKFTILLTLTPISGWISYRVTEGPLLIFNIVTFTPKFLRVCCSLLAVALRCVLESPIAFDDPCFNRETGGNTYGCGFLAGTASSAVPAKHAPASAVPSALGFCGFKTEALEATCPCCAVSVIPAIWPTSESIPSSSFASSYSYFPFIIWGGVSCTALSVFTSLPSPSTSPIKISGSPSSPTGLTGICSVFCTPGKSPISSGNISQTSSPSGFLFLFFLPDGDSLIKVLKETPFAFLSTRRAPRSCSRLCWLSW